MKKYTDKEPFAMTPGELKELQKKAPEEFNQSFRQSEDFSEKNPISKTSTGNRQIF